LRASVTAIDGSDAVRDSISGPAAEAESLGRQLAAELLDRGAAALLAGPQ
jgi:hydroxymethylbilane synthase